MSYCKIVTDNNVKFAASLSNGKQKTNNYGCNEFTLLDGWQILQLTDFDKNCEIKSVSIDGQNINESLFISFVNTHDNNKYNATNINEKVKSWTIFLHNNNAVFKEQICSRIKNSDYGTDLFKNYIQFYDNPISLNHEFTSQIHNFFNYSYGYNAYSLTNYSNIPFIELDLDYPLDIFFNDCKDYKLIQHNNKNHKNWFKYVFCDENNELIKNVNDLPTKNIAEWFYSIGISKLRRLQISKLSSGGYIDLHHDTNAPYENNNTVCNGFYLPINKVSNSYIKFAHGTIAPKGTLIINNMDFVHSAVNDSDDERYVLLVSCELDNNFINKYIKKKQFFGYEY